jgi:pimeloyl-ACP methyl ester carboxylesterase
MKNINIPMQGYELAADLYDEGGNELILCLIGYTSNKTKQSDLLNALCEQTAMNALVFDYSGHGDSPFDLINLTPAQHALETISVFDWINQNNIGKQTTVMGGSYGGYLAVQLSKYREFEKLILRAPGIYKPKDFYTKWGVLGSEKNREKRGIYRRDKEALVKHPMLRRASGFKGKSLVIVHGNDDTCPTETTDAFIRTFHADKLVFTGFPHSIGDIKDKSRLLDYQSKIAEWIVSH